MVCLVVPALSSPRKQRHQEQRQHKEKGEEEANFGSVISSPLVPAPVTPTKKQQQQQEWRHGNHNRRRSFTSETQVITTPSPTNNNRQANRQRSSTSSSGTTEASASSSSHHHEEASSSSPLRVDPASNLLPCSRRLSPPDLLASSSSSPLLSGSRTTSPSNSGTHAQANGHDASMLMVDDTTTPTTKERAAALEVIGSYDYCLGRNENDEQAFLAAAAQARHSYQELIEEQYLQYHLNTSSYYEQHRGDLTCAFHVLEQALLLTTNHNPHGQVVIADDLRRAHLLYRSGRLLWKMGDYVNSYRRLKAARDLYEQHEYGQLSEILVEIHAALGQVARSMGHYKQGKRHYVKALKTIEFDCLFMGDNSLHSNNNANNNNNNNNNAGPPNSILWLQAKVLRNLGLLLLDCEKYEKSGMALREAARIQESLLSCCLEEGQDSGVVGRDGCWHVEYASTLLALGQHYETACGDYVQAAGMYLDALDIYQRQHHQALSMPSSLSASVQQQQGADNAIMVDCRVDMAVTLSRIGWLYYLGQEYEEARVVYQEAFGFMLAVLGEDHANVASLHVQIGMVYAATHQWNRALKRYKKALEIQRQVHGDDNHESVAQTLCLIAAIYNHNPNNPAESVLPHHHRHHRRVSSRSNPHRRTNKALQCVYHALHIRTSLYGHSHMLVAKTFVQLSGLQYLLGHAREAVDSISRAMEIYNKHSLPSSHPLVREARAAMSPHKNRR